jgi:Peptidase inhibitor family I36
VKRISVLFVLIFAVSALAQNRPPGPPQNDPWVYGPQNNAWNPGWNQRPNPRSGACFYTSTGFQGNRFCVRSGDRLPALPGNFGDNISSIQIFGRGRVQIFNDRNYRNGSTVLNRSVPDLRRVPFRNGHTWNNRISSMVVF